jgi:hypothetical protein
MTFCSPIIPAPPAGSARRSAVIAIFSPIWRRLLENGRILVRPVAADPTRCRSQRSCSEQDWIGDARHTPSPDPLPIDLYGPERTAASNGDRASLDMPLEVRAAKTPTARRRIDGDVRASVPPSRRSMAAIDVRRRRCATAAMAAAQSGQLSEPIERRRSNASDLIDARRARLIARCGGGRQDLDDAVAKCAKRSAGYYALGKRWPLPATAGSDRRI